MYEFYDTAAYLLMPSRKFAHTFRTMMRANPTLMDFGAGRLLEGMADMYLRTTRYVRPPEFNIDYVEVDNEKKQVFQTTVMKKPFAR